MPPAAHAGRITLALPSSFPTPHHSARRARPFNRAARLTVIFIAGVLAGACGGEGSAPSTNVELRVRAGDAQFGIPGSRLAEPFEVLATEPGSGAPVQGVPIDWTLLGAARGSLTVVDAETDEFGVSRAFLQFAADTGSFEVEANSARRIRSVPRFTARAIVRPRVDAVAPATAAAGATITITGADFHPTPSQNVVRFSGVRGDVLGGSAATLTVRVPGCVGDRLTSVVVEVGAVRSNPSGTLTTRGGAGTEPVRLQVGQARTFSGAALGCIRLAGEPGAEYLLMHQNAAERPAPRALFELSGFTDPLATAARITAGSAAFGTRDHAGSWELALRADETGWHALSPPPVDIATAAASAALSTPAIGDRRDFKVLQADRQFGTVSAEVVHVSARALLYQDVRAPANGLTAADFTTLGQLFDDPIHATTTAAFGAPSDIDGNGRIIVLFTPRVNELTKASDPGFIAAFFYGCDLLERQRCAGSNRAEIFYSLVPDPTGAFGRRHSAQDVLRTVPAVLAHEFQHMIHFVQKNNTLDALWLSEGLAHAAEDLVADVFQARGQTQRAAEFRASNHQRARQFLNAVGSSALVTEASPGTLEMRGAAWLLVKYLTGHYGGQALFGSLTRSSLSGAANVGGAVSRPWPELLAEFGTALYATGTGLPVEPRQTFNNFAPRSALSLSGGYPLQVPSYPASAFLRESALATSTQEYGFLRVPAGGSGPVHLSLTGLRGGGFDSAARPQLTVLRTR
jgi:hypothetical protein